MRAMHTITGQSVPIPRHSQTRAKNALMYYSCVERRFKNFNHVFYNPSSFIQMNPSTSPKPKFNSLSQLKPLAPLNHPPPHTPPQRQTYDTFLSFMTSTPLIRRDGRVDKKTFTSKQCTLPLPLSTNPLTPAMAQIC